MSDLLVALLGGFTLLAGVVSKVFFDLARRWWIARRVPHAPGLLEIHGAFLQLISGGSHEGRMDELVQVILKTNQAVVERLVAEQQAHIERLVQTLKDTNDEVINHFAKARALPSIPDELIQARQEVAKRDAHVKAVEHPKVWNFTPAEQTPKRE